MEGTSLALYLTSSIIFSIKNVFKDICSFYSIFASFMSSTSQYISYEDDSFVSDNLEEKRATGISYEDVNMVIERLGIHVGSCTEKRWREEVEVFMEVKEASYEELKEAFYVFDRNEDGFITAAELWNVMRRLGMKEGCRMEDCVRMISVFDEDGDGKIGFLEFKKLLENAS